MFTNFPSDISPWHAIFYCSPTPDTCLRRAPLLDLQGLLLSGPSELIDVHGGKDAEQGSSPQDLQDMFAVSLTAYLVIPRDSKWEIDQTCSNMVLPTCRGRS